jgi:hypothetical protein
MLNKRGAKNIMVRIYLDLETFRPKRENAFIEEKIISAGLLIDETPYNEYSLGQKIDPVIISEWKGLNECQIVEKVQDKVKEALLTHNLTVLSGYGILRFDIPLLISRCVQNSMGDINVVTKLWHDCITIDHIQQLLAANGNSFKGASLDNVIATAKRLGLNPPPHNGDGGAMKDLYLNGKFAEIEAHLKEDLQAIRWLDLYGSRKLVEVSVQQGKRLFTPY